MKTLSRIVLTLLVALVAFSSALLYSATPPTLMLSDADNNVVNIDSTGVVVFSGNCTASTCSTVFSGAAPGLVIWAGTIGAFTVNLSSGTTKPNLAPPKLDLSLSQLTTGAVGGVLTVQWTDVNFNNIATQSQMLHTSHFSTGGGVFTLTGYFDTSNAPFGTQILAGTGTASNVGVPIIGPGPNTTPYSMTEIVNISMNPNSNFTTDFNLLAQPCTGVIGDFVWSDTNGNGIQESGEPGINGVTVQLYKGAVLPANLVATNITGPVPSGYTFLTPGAPGYYQFTGLCGGNYNVVVDANSPPNQSVLSGYVPSTSMAGPPATTATDSNGSPAQVNLPNDTAVDETIDFGFVPLQPLTVVCAASTGQVGVSYSSSIVATGGLPPYTFSVPPGALPPGLTLTASGPNAGQISGVPTAAGTFNFTVTVTDSSGLGSGTVTKNCSIVIAPPPSALCLVLTGLIQNSPFSSGPMTGSGGSGSGYTFASSDLPAGLSMAANGSISGTPSVSGSFTYHVTVTDGEGHTGTIECSLTIAPPPSAVCLVLTGLTQGSPFSSGPMTGSGGSGSGYTFASSDLPTGLSMAANGSISGTPSVSGSFTYHVTITDGAGHTGTIACSLTIAPPPSAVCLVLTGLTQGSPFSSGPMTGSGGSGSGYTFASSDLPAGLSMAANGSISGTPSVSGSFTYHVTVTDGAGHTGTIACSLTIASPPTAVCLVLTGLTQGSPFSSGPMTGSGGSGSGYTFASSDLPAGLSMAANGSISGTPSVSGTFTYHVTITDGEGHTGTISCSLTIAPPPSAVCLVLTGLTQGSPFSSGPMTGSGGSGSGYTFASSDLPAGLSMAANGSISGTPSVSGSFTYHVTITDGAGHSGSIACSLTIAPPPSAVCLVLTGLTQGSPFSSGPMTGSGGSGSGYTFASSDLPAGLSMAANGSISGTPSVSGSFTYHVTVTDGAGHTGTIACSLTITTPPTAVCLVLTGLTQGSPFSSGPMTGSGGSGSGYTFASSDLPAGLSMASNGSISGTPSVSGSFTYHVTITDGAGHTGTIACSLSIASPPTAVCLVLTGLTKGSPFSSGPMTGSGGSGSGYTFASSDLPAGLSMASNGSISGTPSVSGTFTYHVTITDGAGHTGTISCSLTIAPPPTAVCLVLTGLIQGSPFSSGAMSGSGGSGSGYTFASSDLPTGLSMASNGSISGTPAVSGSFTYHVTITDGAGHSGSISCSLTVAPPPLNNCGLTWGYWKNHVSLWPATSLTLGSQTYTQTELLNILGLAVSGDASLNLAHQLIAAKLNVLNGTNATTDGGSISAADLILSTFSGKLPYNVAPSSTVGTQMVGIAGQLDTFNSDGLGQPGCKNGPAPQLTLQCASGTGQVGVAYSSSLLATGGLQPYTFAITGGSLPAGLTLNAATGQITGTPTTSGTFSFTATVTDSSYIGTSAGIATVNCSITITAAPTATCVVINAIQGTAITSVTMVGTGGAGGPYTFSATGLPSGLTMSTSGTISGTPTVSGTFAYTVTVKDKNGNAGTVNCSVTVLTVPSASCVTINAIQGTAITPVTMVGTGGAGGPYTFSATGLPSGLTMSTSGTISGTPTVSGTFVYTVTVKDKNGNTGIVNCSVTVAPTAVCVPTTFDLTGGNSSSTGTAGNIRTFTAPNGVQVKVSAFARHKTTSAWTTAWLGAYAPGLGVTDNTESGADPSHKVDNVGAQLNYVMFEFSQPVILNRAYLDYVTTDSDMTIWIGNKTNPFTSHNTLSDAFLTSLGYTEENGTTLTTARWADVNAGHLSGNVIVIAASVADTTPDDYFKISKLETECLPSVSTPTATCVSISASQYTAITPATLIGAGGAGGPYTFTATGLPAGLAMSTTGTISGTPTVSGTFNYSVTVKDKNNVAGTFVCSITVLPAAVCAPSTFDFTSTTNSASTGTAGNIRTFTASNGVQVKVSGFARNKSTGAWSTAWLGSYTPGLGVTDSTESGTDPTHKVDNVGTQVNYVLMEFSQNIVINRAFLDYVGADSDIQVWIGTKTNPFANHITLSDATLTGLGHTENNLTTSPDARWADVNAGNLSGNVIVIAALPTDGDDEFKLSKLDISCTAPAASVVTPVSLANSYNINGIYADGVTFTGGGLDGNGYAYSSNLLGTSLTWNNTPFNFGPATGSDVVDGNAAVIALPAGNFSAVRLLATAVNGNLTGQTFLVTYTDGSTSTFTQSMSDWLTPQNYTGESVGKAMAYRDGSGGTKDNRTFNLYGYSFTLNAAKTVASIKLPASANAEVLAVTLVP